MISPMQAHFDATANINDMDSKTIILAPESLQAPPTPSPAFDSSLLYAATSPLDTGAPPLPVSTFPLPGPLYDASHVTPPPSSLLFFSTGPDAWTGASPSIAYANEQAIFPSGLPSPGEGSWRGAFNSPLHHSPTTSTLPFNGCGGGLITHNGVDISDVVQNGYRADQAAAFPAPPWTPAVNVSGHSMPETLRALKKNTNPTPHPNAKRRVAAYGTSQCDSCLRREGVVDELVKAAKSLRESIDRSGFWRERVERLAQEEETARQRYKGECELFEARSKVVGRVNACRDECTAAFIAFNASKGDLNHSVRASKTWREKVVELEKKMSKLEGQLVGLKGQHCSCKKRGRGRK